MIPGDFETSIRLPRLSLCLSLSLFLARSPHCSCCSPRRFSSTHIHHNGRCHRFRHLPGRYPQERRFPDHHLHQCLCLRDCLRLRFQLDLGCPEPRPAMEGHQAALRG